MTVHEWIERYGRRTLARRKKTVPKKYVGRWVDVEEMLPPERVFVLLQFVAGESCPEVGWLKYAAGDRTSPFFVSGAAAQYVARNVVQEPDYSSKASLCEYHRLHSVMRWFSPTEQGLPSAPTGKTAESVSAFGFIYTATGFSDVCPERNAATPKNQTRKATVRKVRE